MVKIKPGGFKQLYFNELIGAARARYEVSTNVRRRGPVPAFDRKRRYRGRRLVAFYHLHGHLQLPCSDHEFRDTRINKGVQVPRGPQFLRSEIAVKQLPTKRVIVLSEVSLREMRVSKPEKVVYRALKCAYLCVLNSDEAETLFAAFFESGSNKKNAKKQLRVVTMYQYNRMPVFFFSAG